MNNRKAERQPLIAHLHELRRRLLWSSFFCLLGAVVAYVFHPSILAFLVKPLAKPLFYSSPAGAFDLVLRICLFAGFLFALPAFIYHLLKFLGPVLPATLQQRIAWFLLGSCILMLTGISFAYFVSLPAALYFLGEFGSAQVQSLISTDAYFSFVTRYLLGFGILFQLPLVLLLINAVSPLHPRRLMSYQRYVIVASFVLAALITPTPDPFNQTMLALPLILLYQVSVLSTWLINRRKQQPIAQTH